MTPLPKPTGPTLITIDHDDPRIALYKPEEVAAAVAMIGNRKRRRMAAAKLRTKSRT